MLHSIPFEFFKGASVVKPVLAREDITDGNISDDELLLLSSIAANSSPNAIFEIGTFDGRTTLHLAMNSPPTTQIYTLDIPADKAENSKLALDYHDIKYTQKPGSGARFVNGPFSRKIRQIYADSAEFNFEPYHKSMDMIFVDGSHSEPYVRSDTHTALKLVSNRGIIFWHDYNSCWPGVNAALEDFAVSDSRLTSLRHIENTSLVILDLSRKFAAV